MRARTEYLKKDELEVGAWYECDGRNFGVGRWDGEYFTYLRTKFTMKFPCKEYHWDDGPPHGTVKPLQQVVPSKELVNALKENKNVSEL